MKTGCWTARPLIVATVILVNCGQQYDQNVSDLTRFNGQEDLTFASSEIAAQHSHRDEILATAAQCLHADLKRQQDFFANHGISAFYGDRSSFGALSQIGKRNYLSRLGRDPDLVEQMEPTSCVGLTLKCLGKGFEAAGQDSVWKRVRAFTVANGVDGTALQYALQKLDWKIYFWNPNTSRNAAWDQAEKNDDPTNAKRFWGHHAYRYASVIGTRHNYYSNTVDNWTSLVNFGTMVPTSFNDVPFFVGTAHTGYHVFPGSFGQVIEGHSTRLITDPQTIESSEFNPLKQGGGPRGQYRSGMIAIPPGFDF